MKDPFLAPLPDDPFPQNDRLWEILGEAPFEQPDPWLAAKTLARCREAALKRPWRAWQWIGAYSGWATALVFFLFFLASEIDSPLNRETSSSGLTELSMEMPESLPFQDISTNRNWDLALAWQQSASMEEAFDYLAQDSTYAFPF